MPPTKRNFLDLLFLLLSISLFYFEFVDARKKRTHGKTINIAIGDNAMGLGSKKKKTLYTLRNLTFSVSLLIAFIAIAVSALSPSGSWKSRQEKLQQVCKSLLRSLEKFVTHVYSGKGELESICSKTNEHSLEMTIEFANALGRSKILAKESKIVSNLQIVPVPELCDNIMWAKRFHASTTDSSRATKRNLLCCLHDINYVNTVVSRILKLHETAFDDKNALHIALLDEYWSDMTSGAKRRSKAQWKEVGFHGDDPAAELLGTGILGLLQISYFGRLRGAEARQILRDSHDDTKAFPFTFVGITITQFVLQLVQQRDLHGEILALLHERVRGRPDVYDTAEGPSGHADLVDQGCNLVHDLYCDIFEYFSQVWASKHTGEEKFSFQSVFALVKDDFFLKYKKTF
jgi:hypothetical protein